MRSGLDKAGALPLLALIVFSLLTLVPSMSSIYNIKFADFSFFAGTSRRMFLFQTQFGYLNFANLFPKRSLSFRMDLPKYTRKHTP